MDLPHHSLVTECTTRWGTCYKMLERILEQERALVQILGADPKTTHLKPRWLGTEVMESVVSALKPISDLTDILSGEERVTASCLKPLLNHLLNEALAEKEGDTTLKSDIQQRIKEYMKRKYRILGIMRGRKISRITSFGIVREKTFVIHLICAVARLFAQGVSTYGAYILSDS